jgi:hypothetical protein
MYLDDETAAKMISCAADLQRIASLWTSLVADGVRARGGQAPGAIVVPSEGTQPERVLGYLRQRPEGCTRRELMEAFPEMGNNSLSGAITRLKERALIEVLGRGRYRARVR